MVEHYGTLESLHKNVRQDNNPTTPSSSLREEFKNGENRIWKSISTILTLALLLSLLKSSISRKPQEEILEVPTTPPTWVTQLLTNDLNLPPLRTPPGLEINEEEIAPPTPFSLTPIPRQGIELQPPVVSTPPLKPQNTQGTPTPPTDRSTIPNPPEADPSKMQGVATLEMIENDPYGQYHTLLISVSEAYQYRENAIKENEEGIKLETHYLYEFYDAYKEGRRPSLLAVLNEQGILRLLVKDSVKMIEEGQLKPGEGLVYFVFNSTGLKEHLKTVQELETKEEQKKNKIPNDELPTEDAMAIIATMREAANKVTVPPYAAFVIIGYTHTGKLVIRAFPAIPSTLEKGMGAARLLDNQTIRRFEPAEEVYIFRSGGVYFNVPLNFTNAPDEMRRLLREVIINPVADPTKVQMLGDFMEGFFDGQGLQLQFTCVLVEEESSLKSGEIGPKADHIVRSCQEQ